MTDEEREKCNSCKWRWKYPGSDGWCFLSMMDEPVFDCKKYEPEKFLEEEKNDSSG